MCYYSRTMNSREFRDAKENEDLTVSHDGHGHSVARATSDKKIVCVMDKTQLNIENFQVDNIPPNIFEAVRHLIGKEVSAQFVEYHFPDTGVIHRQHASDAIIVAGTKVHLAWFKQGTKCYIGEKRVPPVKLETRLGVDDPSIHLDHKEPSTILDRVLSKVTGLCSITR